jgi:hypothetical protein
MAKEARQRACKLLLDVKGEQDDYRRYLSSFWDDPQASDLRKALEKVRLDAVSKTEDAKEIAIFLAQYPGIDGVGALKAKSENDVYRKAKALGTRLAWQWFLKSYPHSQQAGDIKARLQEAAPRYFPTKADVEGQIGQIREGSTAFRNLECRKILTAAIAREKDLFSAKAETLRSELASAYHSADSVTASCSGVPLTIAPGEKETASRALGALAELANQRRALAALLGDPDDLAAKAEELSQTASSFADDAEGKEQEEEALYNRASENPDDPKDSAAENAREASRRARAAAKTAGALGGGRSEMPKLIQRMNTQAELLLKIVASVEQEPSRSPHD